MRIRKRYIKGPVNITIAASVRSPDIRALAISAGWIGYEPIYCTINAGVDVSNLTISGISNGLLTIFNRGRIGAEINTAFGIYTRVNISIDNAGGTIFGIGGRGGDGGSLLIQNPNSPSFFATGQPGLGGRGGGFAPSGGSIILVTGVNGDTGTSVTLGGSSIGGIGVSTGGRGSYGGDVGQPGQTGDPGTATGNYNLVQTYSPLPGAAAGNYIDGNAFVNWLALGTRLGNAI